MTDPIQSELDPFLASPAATVDGATADEVESITRLFLTVVVGMMGRPPHLLSGGDMHGALGHELPNHFPRKAPLAEKVPAVLRAYVGWLTETRECPHAFDLKRGLEGTLPEFLQTVRTGVNPHTHHHHHHHAQQTVRRDGPKVGRNDACPCGSGKKYKKCCGK